MSREFPSNHTQNNHLNLTSQFIQQIGRVDKVNPNSQIDPPSLGRWVR